ncbi:MAG: tetratricopeptide repeat protein [Hungatella sp.]|nr:tetratricopeptide repeat protein [Hungatella sp.]
MDYARRCQRIANGYYNQGLEKAKIRDLTGAAECLKKSLHFHKYQTDARNLLGLIYYEMGETAESLVQWVISMNLQPDKNRAALYLREIQDKPGRLEAESQNIKKYNQGLYHAQTGSDDLAVLLLGRVVEFNPHFVKAHLVLALLYMSHGDYTKAGKSLQKVLQIDKSHPKALWYMSIVKSHTGRAEVERRKMDAAFSHRQMQDDDIILPPTYKETTGWLTIINIAVGLVLGAAVIWFLVMPAMERELNHRHNQEMTGVLEQVNQKNLELDALKSDISSMESERDNAMASLLDMQQNEEGVIRQYQRLVQILKAQAAQDMETVATVYADMDISLITDPDTAAVVGEITNYMTAEGFQVLADLGDKARDGKKQEEALDYYQKSLNIKGDNPQVIYDMAMIYQSRDERDKANELLGQVIMNYPNTELAVLAKEARGY